MERVYNLLIKEQGFQQTAVRLTVTLNETTSITFSPKSLLAEQWQCIIITNLALFWLILNKMCRFFNSYEESLCVYVFMNVYKLAKYVRNCVVFWKIYTANKNFTRPPVATVATNSKSGFLLGIY